MLETHGWAAYDPTSPLRSYTFHRRDPGPDDVQVEILYCGVCHSDLHQVRNEWHGSAYPMVPGHEIVGRVVAAGARVTRFRTGDTVGIGCMVDSCRGCDACARGLEQYCDGCVFTYNSNGKDGARTQGGYSTQIVVDQRFLLAVRATERLEAVAPLLCAGITVWSPLRTWQAGPGARVAVVGLGGLGHMGVKLARALGAEVTLVSSSPKKRADAERLGAHDFLLGSDAAQLESAAGRFDLVLDTVSATHDLVPLAKLLRLDGTLVLLGVPETPASLPAMPLISRRRRIAGSLIGGIPETQEMLDFCAARNLTADVEVIRAQEIDGAYARMLKGDVRYRFVIDTASLK